MRLSVFKNWQWSFFFSFFFFNQFLYPLNVSLKTRVLATACLYHKNPVSQTYLDPLLTSSNPQFSRNVIIF